MTELDDARGDRLKSLDEFTLADLDALRLILRGSSVIDWRRLEFSTDEQAREFLAAQELDPDDPVDSARMDRVKTEAVAYFASSIRLPNSATRRAIERARFSSCGVGQRPPGHVRVHHSKVHAHHPSS